MDTKISVVALISGLVLQGQHSGIEVCPHTRTRTQAQTDTCFICWTSRGKPHWPHKISFAIKVIIICLHPSACGLCKHRSVCVCERVCLHVLAQDCTVVCLLVAWHLAGFVRGDLPACGWVCGACAVCMMSVLCICWLHAG